MKIAVMGYGTIGSGVVEVLDTNKEIISHKLGEPIEVSKVLDLRDFPGSPIEDKLVRDYQDIARDPDIDVVVETMGGVEPAFTFVSAMLEAGKSVATSNKALVEAKGTDLISLAKAKGVHFLFEASVGGGIPIIRPLRTSLAGEDILEITGIINGTTNYMLTKMTADGSDFDDVLHEAQALGYAEKDPTADIEGHDPCRKIAILTSLIAGRQVDFADIPCEGITGISAVDICYAKALGRKIKLFATSRRAGSTYACMVAPFMISPSHRLYSVDDVLNGILVVGNMLGDVMFFGSGAGKLPTASAVVSDVIEIGLHRGKRIPVEWAPEKLVLADTASMEFAFFVRVGDDVPRDDVSALFGDVEFIGDVASGEYGFVTGVMKQADFEEKVSKLSHVLNKIRLQRG